MAVPATREALRLGGNLNFGAGGLSIGFLVGTFVKSVVENELTGSITITYQDAGGANQVSTLESSLITNAERHDLNSIMGLLAKTADLQVEVTAREWGDVTDLAQGGFVSEDAGNLGPVHAAALAYVLAKTATAGDSNNDYVYIRIPSTRDSRDYRIRQDGSLGEFFITSWDHVGTEGSFDYYRSRHNLFQSYTVTIQYDAATAAQTHYRGKTDWANIENKEERFTEVDQEILDDLSRITFPHPTDDWQIRQTYSVRDFFADRYATFLSLGWDADNRLRALSGDGHVARLGGHDRGRIYDGSDRLRAGLISGAHWLFLRDNEVHGGSDIERAPVDGGDSAVEFEINSIRYFSMFADPDSGTLIGILRRISATDMEVGLLAYDATAGTVTAEDTITLTRAHIDAALGADFLPLADIHRETAGGAYQDVAGAILEGDTLYLLLTDILKADGHTTSALVGFTLAGTPNNRTLTILAENPVDELPIADELTSGILPLEADELFIARDTAAYRLSPPVVSDIDASDVTVDTSNFNGKLASTDDTLQKVADKVDDFIFASGGGGTPAWTDVTGRPNRPSAAELLAGTNTDEAVPSVSDVVALVNNHRLIRSNADPENVGNEALEGDAAEVSRRNHGHRFPHDGTIQYDADNAQFGVSVHDVIEHLQESVQYYTGTPYDYSQGGGESEGQVYTTSAFDKTINRIRFRFIPVGGTRYEARILQVHDDNRVHSLLGTSQFRTISGGGSHHFDFTSSSGEVGIPVRGGTRIAIVLSRLGGGIVAGNRGTQASDSPNESYDDASQDFVLQNSVVYDNENPPVDHGTHSHGDHNDIRGNIEIFYTLSYNHGRFVGTDFALSDAVPQANTEDGAAGDSEEASRSNHEHPGIAGGGGAATLGGNTAETLFDNRAPTETALNVLAGSPDWGRTVDFGFTRALVEADDDKDLRIRFQITQGGQIRHFGYLTSADTFRLMPEYPAASGTVLPTGGHLLFEGADGRVSRTATSLFSRLNIGVRQRTATGEDALRLLLSLSGNSHVAATNIRGIIELVPRVENLTITGGGGGEQQQIIGGRNLATREVVAGDILIAANNFDFDLSGDGTIALGRYALSPTPRTDIFDFVATVRVGGRAGNQIRLSKEQFDYVGEYDIQSTWPFGGTGGGSWGNVTEIPCAMLSVNHRSEGVSKTQLRPQRQQIGWTIDSQGTAATAILFFFSYNSSGQVDFVEMVVFTDQVVEIEGVHFHYWEDA